ncbi:hypothetical protein HDU67_000263 [Dinochytrium kinnereticum]|nr:hypothetical protein HDU67_000263 [Dinochytrium kinnereticum]
MPALIALLLLFSLILHPLAAAPPPVAVAHYSLDPSTAILQGDLKSVTIYYRSTVSGWSTANNVTASFTSAITNTAFETWSFKAKIANGVAADATAFYVKAVIGGVSYYANNNNANFPLAPSTPSQSAIQPGKFFDRIMVIYLENTDYAEAIADPFMGGTLASQGILLTNYMAQTHPSQGNYIAAIAGELCGVTGNTNYELSQWNLIDGLRNAGISWKGYMEGFPSPCFQGISDGLYWRKHNPFISFPSIRNTQCDRIVDSVQISIDEATNNLPSFMWFTPDQNNGMQTIPLLSNHVNNSDTYIPPVYDLTTKKTKKNDGNDPTHQYATANHTRYIPPRKTHPVHANTLFLITFDESENYLPNQNIVYALLAGHGVDPLQRGTRDDRRVTHYSILKTVLENWGLPGPGKGEVAAALFPVVAKGTATPSTTTTTTTTTDVVIPPIITTSSTSVIVPPIITTTTSPPATTIFPPTPTGPVGVISYSYGSSTLSGRIQVQNLAYAKTVTVYYQDGAGGWLVGNAVPARYAGSAAVAGFEEWSFLSVITPKPRAFYVKYTVMGKDYYDSNAGRNHVL